MKRGEDIWRGG
jgi:hypothetical protein